ncbi:hypothetical protein GGTG_05361 [Gaeumannomyces tritici R3-111a-1]|uniref:Uncharacterized protein n=1 Tax=Gaeumannomyces tritici (strain R3-111a-1) TaxID=644352 RepID=J3NVP8_GAET3|nr:hypothetical protein GGTG_05361 [Gaeumannomyces tritici R3-111a-1]EJT75426.1 hypothetical protein GGTG_05361 [Gaeumannomyces tritici R3-111a-1]
MLPPPAIPLSGTASETGRATGDIDLGLGAVGSGGALLCMAAPPTTAWPPHPSAISPTAQCFGWVTGRPRLWAWPADVAPRTPQSWDLQAKDPSKRHGGDRSQRHCVPTPLAGRVIHLLSPHATNPFAGEQTAQVRQRYNKTSTPPSRHHPASARPL